MYRARSLLIYKQESTNRHCLWNLAVSLLPSLVRPLQYSPFFFHRLDFLFRHLTIVT